MKLFLFLLQNWSGEQMASEMEQLGNAKIWVHLVPIVFWLVVATALLAVVMSLINMIKNPQALVGFLIGLAVLAGLFLVAYLMAGSDVPEAFKGSVTGNMSKLIGAGIGTAFILMAFGLVMLVVDLIRGIFKL